MKKLIASADRQAMTSLLQGSLVKRAGGLIDKDSPFVTEQVIDDHKEYVDTMQSILTEDKTESFPPNDPILD